MSSAAPRGPRAPAAAWLRVTRSLPKLPGRRAQWAFWLLLLASSTLLAGCVLAPLIEGAWWLVVSIAALIGLAACGGGGGGGGVLPTTVLVPQVTTLNGGLSFGTAGNVVASAGDFNGDGKADILIGAPNASLNGGNVGVAYLVLGDPPAGVSNLDTLTGSGGPGLRLVGDSGNAGIQIGSFVGAGGDVTTDGKADLIVTHLTGTGTYGGCGEAYVVYGTSVSGGDYNVTASNITGLRVIYNGAASNDARKAVGIGDFDGDGIPDLIVGGPSFGTSGIVSIVSGGWARTNTNPFYNTISESGSSSTISWYGLRLAGATGSTSGLGTSVAAPGDLNKDGRPDAAAGAPSENAPSGGTTNVGAVHVLFGKMNAFCDTAGALCAASGANITDVGGSSAVFSVPCSPATSPTNQVAVPKGFAVYGPTNGGQFGAAIAAGDVNGDGNIDLIIGAPGTNSSAGRVYVVFGPFSSSTVTINLGTSAPNGCNACYIDGPSGGSQVANFGTSVAAVDLNGDGKADIVVGVPGADSPTVTATGAVAVILGKADVGVSGSGVCNVDIGSSNVDFTSTDIGASAVSFGNDGLIVYGTATFDQLGQSVANAGDVNGDGRADLIVGAPGVATNKGAAYVIKLVAQ